MPIIRPSTYRPSPLMANGHLQTILPSLLRRVNGVRYQRERIATPDDDFIDLDWSRRGSRHLALLCHGLEGSSQATYMRGMARALNQAGWDAVAYNYRGCSGTINRRLRAYHSIGFVGFSLGGNLVLKYLGENAASLDPERHWAAAVSVPCDLKASARQLDRAVNQVYNWRFLRTLTAKARWKAHCYPGCIDTSRLPSVRSLKDFDDVYTAPVHGFRDAEDYWRRCSALRFVNGIRIPTLLINALNDPFLAPPCFPYDAARRNDSLFLETPTSGGHVGFLPSNPREPFWHEARVVQFAGAHHAGSVPRAAAHPTRDFPG
ncbi:MAG: alpha/beta fold hydrolase [Desulfobacteraceae bacterium]|nr:alpha/beta fold hydrolase [Desulfobacteraceae bacterium]